MKGTITGRIPHEYRAVDFIAQDRAMQRAFPHGIKQHVRADLERRGYHVEDGVHDSLIATNLADVEARLVQHYTSGQAAIDELERALAPQRAILERIVTRLAQLLCGLRGHDSVLHFEGRRVMMRCTSCKHDTPGWETSGRAPRQRFGGDPSRHVITKAL